MRSDDMEQTVAVQKQNVSVIYIYYSCESRTAEN